LIQKGGVKGSGEFALKLMLKLIAPSAMHATTLELAR
jgi:hypothetical protein